MRAAQAIWIVADDVVSEANEHLSPRLRGNRRHRTADHKHHSGNGTKTAA
jgi:hypothetical protein